MPPRLRPRASPPALASSGSSDAKSSGKLLASGFGQEGPYLWVTALVKNTSQDVGQFVTVQFNVLNQAGDIIASQSQVESFSRSGQTLVLGTQVDLTGK